MKHTVPHSPFSLCLSGSKKETELRLRSIFQWKKKRPPVISLILAALMVLLCFGLFSCQSAPEETPQQENDLPVAESPGQDPAVETTPPAEEPIPSENATADTEGPVLTVAVDALLETMKQLQEEQFYPALRYRIEVTGLSTPVTLIMQLGSVAAVEAHGHHVDLTKTLDIYGNCGFDLFEVDEAVILQGDYYWIGDIYVLTPEHTSEVHPGETASYYVYLDEQGNLRYRLSHNQTALITQTSFLSAATEYGEFWRANGDASIVNGELIFAEPDEEYFMDRDVLQALFQEQFSQYYDCIEALFAANRAGKAGDAATAYSYHRRYRDQLILGFYAHVHLCNTFRADSSFAQPQRGDLRLDEVILLGETPVDGMTGQLVEVRLSRLDYSGWEEFTEYLVLTKNPDYSYEKIVGKTVLTEGQTVEEIIRQKISP